MPALPGTQPRPTAPRQARAAPQVVAHRGASHDVAEHTLGAYRRAIEAGADALECDVRLTADGHLVCVHDRRVDRTSNGRGLVSTLELAQLEGLDWGSWRAQQGEEPEVPDRDRGRLLTLKRLLATVADSGSAVELAIETKHPSRYGGRVERAVVDLLEYFGWSAPRPDGTSRVRVMSFSQLALQRTRGMAPGLPLVLLSDRWPRLRRVEALPPGVGTAGISMAMLRACPGLVGRVQRGGARVHVWTVDHPDDVQRCVDAGVDAIITNRPQQVLDQLGRGRSAGATAPAGGAASAGAAVLSGAVPAGR